MHKRRSTRCNFTLILKLLVTSPHIHTDSCLSPPHIFTQIVGHGTIAFLEYGPAVPVLLDCPHEDAEKEHHTPILTAVHAYFEFGAGPLIEQRPLHEENKVHPHTVMTWKGFVVDKWVAKGVLVTYVKAAED